jgi:hypothetical protein
MAEVNLLGLALSVAEKTSSVATDWAANGLLSARNAKKGTGKLGKGL